jgi:integrase
MATYKQPRGGELEGIRRQAGRLQRLLKDVLRSAGIKNDYNPGTWENLKGEGSLARKQVETESFAAMPWQDIPAFTRELLQDPPPAGRRLRFTILTAARSSEAIAANWSNTVRLDDGSEVPEIDLDKKL